ncbi:MAG: hypothetical protein ACOX6V_02715 [Patescibacteria group bacterium]|jgi:uncharacterized repeat protein (TIGR01451 family)
MKKLLFALFFVATGFLIYFLTTAESAYASRICREVYGGGLVCEEKEIDVDKVVFSPHKNTFVDNIPRDELVFSSGETVTFELRVTNTGNIVVHQVTLKDFLPNWLEWQSGGDTSGGSGVVQFEVFDLDPGETETRSFQARIKDTSALSEMAMCVTNKVVAMFDSEEDIDTANFCIAREAVVEKEEIVVKEKVLGVEELPPTGTNFPLVLLAGPVGFFALGSVLLMLAKK